MSIKNSKELKTFLLSQISGIADGSVAPEMAKGICNLSQQVYNLANLEIKVAIAKVKVGEDGIKSVNF